MCIRDRSKALTPFSPSSWEKSSNILFWNASLIPNAFPGGIAKVTLDAFTAIAVHSDMKRTGYLSCSNDSLNKLFSNIIWGQKGNFVDVPTDCQQRDERLGWAGGKHYGDWLGLDAPSGSYKGASDETFIASAFYAYSTSLVIKAGNVLDKDVSEFEDLYAHIIKTFRSQYPVYHTQTECVLAAHFKLAENCQAAADQLAEMITACGNHLETGFVGTPYLLHVLSEYGHLKLAYTLLPVSYTHLPGLSHFPGSGPDKRQSPLSILFSCYFPLFLQAAIFLPLSLFIIQSASCKSN